MDEPTPMPDSSLKAEFAQFLGDLREVFRQELAGSGGLSSGSRDVLEPLGIRSAGQLNNLVSTAQTSDDIRRIREAVEEIRDIQKALFERQTGGG